MLVGFIMELVYVFERKFYYKNSTFMHLISVLAPVFLITSFHMKSPPLMLKNVSLEKHSN